LDKESDVVVLTGEVCVFSRKMTEDGYNPCKPRFVMMKKCHPRDDLGVTLIGGNAVGIFVHSIHPNTVASSAKGLRCGDHILEVS